MNTTKVILIIAAVAIPVAAVAILAGSSGGGTKPAGNDCGRLVITDNMTTSEALNKKLLRLDPGMPAIMVYEVMFRGVFPNCPFTAETKAVVVFQGQELDWQQMRGALKDKTIGELLRAMNVRKGGPITMRKEGAAPLSSSIDQVLAALNAKMLDAKAMAELSKQLSETPVPVLGERWTDNEHFWTWGNARIRTFRVPNHDGWLWELYWRSEDGDLKSDFRDSLYNDLISPLYDSREQFQRRQLDKKLSEGDALVEARWNYASTDCSSLYMAAELGCNG